MRIFGAEQAIALGKVSEDTLAKSCVLFESLAPIKWLKPGTMRAAVRAGCIDASQVSFDGMPVLVLFHHCSDGCLHINGAQAIDRKHHYSDTVFDAVDILARSKGCTKIRFLTLLQALARSATQRGYELEALCFTKETI